MNAVELNFQRNIANNRNNSSSRQILLQSLKSLPYVIAACLFSTAIWLLHHELTKTGLQEILSNLRMIRSTQLLEAFAFTALSFLVLTCYDALALRHIQSQLPYSRIALGSFIACAFSQSLGFHLLTSASIRYKLYSSWKLEASEIAKVVVFTTITFWLGILSIAGISLIFASQSNSNLFPILAKFAPVIGILLCSIVGLYLIWGTFCADRFPFANSLSLRHLLK